MRQVLTYSILGVLLAFGLVWTLLQVQPVGAAAPSGIATAQQVATTTQVGPQETVTIFSDIGATCNSRVISTTDGTNQGITLLFGDPTNGDVASTSLSATVGHLQAGSTTTMYDSGLYGCGRWTAYAEASTTILISEFR